MPSSNQRIFTSPEFQNPAVYFTRYSWPVEFVVRALKETGWTGFSAGSALSPLINMNQELFDPPDVAGWSLGTYAGRPGWRTGAGMVVIGIGLVVTVVQS